MTIDSQTETISHCQPSKSIELKTNSNYIYVICAILYFASITVVAIFVWNVHQVNDLSVLRENLRNDLVVSDIKHIVQSVLREYTPLDDIRQR